MHGCTVLFQNCPVPEQWQKVFSGGIPFGLDFFFFFFNMHMVLNASLRSHGQIKASPFTENESGEIMRSRVDCSSSAKHQV